MKIILLSDLHISKENIYPNYYEKLALDISNNLNKPQANYSDALVIAGDIVDRGYKDGFEKATDKIRQILSTVGLSNSQIIVVPGNHDLTFDSDNRNSPPSLSHFDNFASQLCIKSFDYNTKGFNVFAIPNQNYLFVGFNTTGNKELDRSQMANGVISKEILFEAEKELNKIDPLNKYKKIAVFHHHFCQYNSTNLNEQPVLKNAFLFNDFLLNHHFIGVLHGHRHFSNYNLVRLTEKDVLFSIGSGSSGAFPPNPYLFNTPEYQILDISEDETIIEKRHFNLMSGWQKKTRLHLNEMSNIPVEAIKYINGQSEKNLAHDESASSEEKKAEKIKLFISHSTGDKPIVKKIVSFLERNGFNVWYDANSIESGDSIPSEINNGLTECDIFIIALSKKAIESRWVIRELDFALMKHLSPNNLKIIPILLEECEIPSLLYPLKYIDFKDSFSNGVKYLIENILVHNKI